MKRIFTTLLMFVNLIFAQIQEPQNSSVEFYMGTENVSPVSKQVKIHLTAVGTVWATDDYFNFSKTNYLNDSNFIPSPNNEPIAYWDGWDFVSSRDNDGEYPAFGY